MCGIAGITGGFDPAAAQAAVGRMLAAQVRRGPDAEGMECWDGALLGHRRLSIFDLSEAGRQPMVSSDRAVGVVFNGAIYNFPLLRQELEQRGCQFRSRTDTEVLLHGYREWGIDELVRRLRGMFAFGLWDARQQKLFLVRDRLGVKPLIYALGEGQIAFASTVRALACGGFARTVDDLAVAEALEYGHITDARTIYREASKLAAASILEWRQGSARIRRYWEPLPEQPRAGLCFDEAVEETERLLLEAVRRRLYADVPVGVLLSGGVDSSLVCWAITRLGADITAFTVGTPGAAVDETAEARATAAALGLRHVVLPLPGDDTALLDDLIEAYAEPFPCGSALGLLGISKLIKTSATVLLTGDGGDDVFLGYPRNAYAWWAQRLAGVLPGPAVAAWRRARALVPPAGPLRRARHFLNYSTGGLGALVRANPGLPECRRADLLGDRLKTLDLPERSIPESHASARNLLSELLAFEQQHRFVGEYMTKVDGAAMFYALEARAPFLDQELWEFAASLPYQLRLYRNRLKAVLRELARRRVDAQVAVRRKRGFTIPVEQWLAQRWHARAQEVFQDALLARHGYARAEGLQKQLAAARQRGRAPLHLWYLFVLELWLRHAAAQHRLAFG